MQNYLEKLTEEHEQKWLKYLTKYMASDDKLNTHSFHKIKKDNDYPSHCYFICSICSYRLVVNDHEYYSYVSIDKSSLTCEEEIIKSIIE